MMTIHSVAGDSDYFKKDDYYAKEAGAFSDVKYTNENGEEIQAGTWTFNADIIKEKFGVDLEQVGAERTFDSLVEAGVGSNEMVGQDLTFSAPKSVSLAFTLGNEEIRQSVYESYRAAVERTLEFINDNMIKTRETTNGETIHVQGTDIAAVAFDHILSREQDPQLHTHVVILNQTTRETDGATTAIDFGINGTLTGADRRNLDTIFKSELARNLAERGIAVEWSEDGRNFEIKGVTEEQIQAFSQREQQILEYAEKNNLDMTNQKEREQAILETRESKTRVDYNDLRQEWQERAKAVGLDINRVIEENRLSKEQINNMVSNYEISAESDVARQVINDMQGTFSKDEFYALAAQAAHQLGREFSLDKSEQELEKLQEIGAVISLGEVDGREQFATKQFIEAEKYLVETIDRTLNQGTGFVSEKQFEKDMQEFKEKFKQENGFWLSPEQEQALKTMFTSDRFMSAIQGYAGVGKSALFKAANEYGQWLGEKYGQEQAVNFVGLAPTGQAAKVLEESSGIKSQTIHSFLQQQAQKTHIKETLNTATGGSRISVENSKGDELTGRTIVVMDEAGMVDARTMKELVETLNSFNEKNPNNNIRLQMAGDTNQFQSVGAGKTFEMLQRKGIETSSITGIRRQKDPAIREALREFANGNPDKLRQEFESRGWINEIKDKDQMQQAILDKYTELLNRAGGDPSRVMTIAQTNKTVDALNQAIRNYLIENGKIDTTEKAQIEVIKDRSNTYKAKDYQNVDDRTRQELTKEQKIAENRVIKTTTINTGTNIISRTEIKQDKQEQEAREFVVGERKTETKEFAKGDRIVFLKNDKNLDVQNGLQGTITKIDKENNTMTVRTDAGKEVSINWTRYNNFDYAYAITGHKSQGATVDSAIVVDEGNMTKNAAYVAATRAKYETHIFTRDKEKLYRNMEIRQNNRSALELLEQREKEQKLKQNKSKNKNKSERNRQRTQASENKQNRQNKTKAQQQEKVKQAQHKQDKTETKQQQEQGKKREQERVNTEDKGKPKIKNDTPKAKDKQETQETKAVREPERKHTEKQNGKGDKQNKQQENKRDKETEQRQDREKNKQNEPNRQESNRQESKQSKETRQETRETQENKNSERQNERQESKGRESRIERMEQARENLRSRDTEKTEKQQTRETAQEQSKQQEQGGYEISR